MWFKKKIEPDFEAIVQSKKISDYQQVTARSQWGLIVETKTEVVKLGSEANSIIVDVILNQKAQVLQVYTVPDDAMSITDRVREQGWPLREVMTWIETNAYVAPYVLNYPY